MDKQPHRIPLNWRQCIWWLVLALLAFYGGPIHSQTLSDYLQIAGENNPGLQAQYKAYEAALQKIPQVNSLPDPQVSFGYFLLPVETRVGPQQARFSLSQMFPWFGTLAAQEDVAAKNAAVQFQRFLDARNALFLQVKQQYYKLYDLEQQISITADDLALLSSYENVVRVRYENNQTSMVDVIRVQMRMEELETQQKLLQEKRIPLQAEFNALLNRPGDQPVEVQDTLPLLPMDSTLFMPEQTAKHPQLLALQQQEAAAAAEVQVAVKAGLPNLGVGLDYVLVDERSDAILPDNGQNVVMPMVTATVPLFRKKYRAQRKEAELRQAQFELAATDKATRLKAAFDRVAFQWEEAYERGQLYQKLTERAEQALRIMTTAYANGELPFEELLRMEEELLDYELKYAKAIADQYRYQAELQYITGQDL